ncbi:MAG TPA: YbjN domain-containing protein [Nostocaceae cyanobacterium]|nr:YbjN domain-containing protein [Nostocaceae cyanobacterium]
MNTKTNNYQINSDLTLYTSSNLPLTVQVINIAVTETDDKITEYRLAFQVNPELYNFIDTNALFNLNPVVRINSTNINFYPNSYIQIEVIIKPDFLPLLIENLNTIDSAATYILNCNLPDPLLFTENWLALSVKQLHETGEVGYYTFWNYFSSLNLAMASNYQEEIAENLTKFLQDLVSLGLDSTTKEVNPASLEELAKFFRELSEASAKTIPSNTTPKQPIYQAIIDFFQQDDWPFEQIRKDSWLRTTFQGKNGRWSCYAQANDTYYQFIFYSVCPVKVPEFKRQLIAEFIARANYNIIIGNFELDFRDGEIRYKTSVDIEDNSLTFTCIKNLVYTNVKMMDKYLPGIISIINDDISPDLAINQIEQGQKISQASNEVVEVDKFVLDLPSQTNVNQQETIPEHKEHILTILTREEIGKFHEALQVLPRSRRKQAEEIIARLKPQVITRLGESGEEIFNLAYSFFSEVKIVVKNIKLIQRYSGMADEIKLVLQDLQNENTQDREILEEEKTAISELENLFWCINTRLQELPTDNLEGMKEVELLREIEEFRYQFIQFKRLMENKNV